MICPKCGANLVDGREYCVNCGTPVEKPLSYGGNEPIVQEKDYGPRSFLKTKNGVIMMGIGEIIIGILGTLYVFVRFAELDAEIAVISGMVVGIWAVLIPVIGLICIGVNAFKPGGVIMIIGSIPCFPIGMVGITAGKNAMALE